MKTQTTGQAHPSASVAPSATHPPAPPSGAHPAVVPDTHAEEILFNLYQSEKARAQYWHDRARKAEAQFAAFRAKHLARGVGRALAKPAHNDQPTGKRIA